MATQAPRVVVRIQDMEQEMMQFSIDQAADAIEKYIEEKDIASALKQAMTNEFGPTWHCMVGRHFASYVTYEKNRYIYFYIGQMGFMLFKTP